MSYPLLEASTGDCSRGSTLMLSVTQLGWSSKIPMSTAPPSSGIIYEVFSTVATDPVQRCSQVFNYIYIITH